VWARKLSASQRGNQQTTPRCILSKPYRAATDRVRGVADAGAWQRGELICRPMGEQMEAKVGQRVGVVAH